MIYKRIKDLREDQDLTQEQIAQYLHISQRTYSHYENGDRAIPLDILSRLATYYDTSTDFLLNRTDYRIPYPKTEPFQ